MLDTAGINSCAVSGKCKCEPGAYGDGCDSGVPPTPPPTPPTPTPASGTFTLKQTVTYSSISVAQYSSLTKKAYDWGYADFLGIHDNTTTTGISSGNTLSSTASRRKAAVAYTAIILAELIAAATAAANNPNAAANLQAIINAVIASNPAFANVPKAVVESITNAIVTSNTPTPSTTPVAGAAVVTQTATFTQTVAYSGYTQTAYNKGYGTFLGIYNTALKAYTASGGVTSSVTGTKLSRRGSVILFTATVDCAHYIAEASQQQASKLQDAIQLVIASEYKSLGVPDASPVSSLSEAVQASLCSGYYGGSSGLDGGAIAGIVIGSIVGFVLIVAIVWFVACRKPAHEPSGEGKVVYHDKNNEETVAEQEANVSGNDSVVADKTLKI